MERSLRQSTTQGRTVLQRILRGLTFTPQIDPHTGEMVGYSSQGRPASTNCSRASLVLRLSMGTATTGQALNILGRRILSRATTAACSIGLTRKGWRPRRDSSLGGSSLTFTGFAACWTRGTQLPPVQKAVVI